MCYPTDKVHALHHHGLHDVGRTCKPVMIIPEWKPGEHNQIH